MRASHNDNWIMGLCVIAMVLAFVFLTGCTDPKGATRVLESNGYTEIEITGWRPFMKSKGDYYSTGFKAKSSNGKIVTGSVTGGLIFKGNTIRFD